MDFNQSEPEVKFNVRVMPPEIIKSIIIVAFIMIATIVGNLTLITAIFWKRSRLVKRVDIFLVNLAIGDLTVAFITMPTEILFKAFSEWVIGGLMCKISVYLQIVTLASTSFLMTGMSIDRYQVIVKPLQSLRSRPKIRTKVLTAWVMAFIFALPQLFIFVQVEKTKPDGRTQRKCVSKGYTNDWQRKVYFTYLTTYLFVIPGIIMFYCYLNIIRVVFSRKNDIRRVVTMTLTVILVFVICHMPYFIIILTRTYSNNKIKWENALRISEAIFMTHSALNPILYGIFSLRIEHFYKVLNTCLCLVPVGNVIEREISVDSQEKINNLGMLRSRLGLGNNHTAAITNNGQTFPKKNCLGKNVGRAFRVTFKQTSNSFQSTVDSQGL